MTKTDITKKYKENLIDLDRVIKNQKSKSLKRMPQFAVNIIKRIIKQKKMNDLFNMHRDKHGVVFVRDCIAEYNVTAKVHGIENIPKKGKYIFVSNHPLGAADYSTLIVNLSLHFKNIKVLANEVISTVENIKELILPVGVFSKTSKKSKDAIDVVMGSEDMQILTFPAGTVSRKEKGKVVDKEWHKSFVRYAQKYKRNVVPILVNETNSRMFYFVYQFRKLIGLKLNLELFLIPGEFFKKKNKVIPVFIGKPISYERFDDSKSHFEWAQIIKNEVYALSK